MLLFFFPSTKFLCYCSLFSLSYSWHRVSNKNRPIFSKVPLLFLFSSRSPTDSDDCVSSLPLDVNNSNPNPLSPDPSSTNNSTYQTEQEIEEERHDDIQEGQPLEEGNCLLPNLWSD
jgi:hypothetical protein